MGVLHIIQKQSTVEAAVNHLSAVEKPRTADQPGTHDVQS